MRTAVAFLALFAGAAAFARTATSSLTGRVTSSGSFAGGVTVTAASKALQRARTTVTTSEGRYWLTALPPGEYEVTFSKTGLQTLTKRVIVELGRVARLHAAIEPSEDEESVTATGTTVNVTETTAITTHFADDTLDRLPYRRDATRIAFLAPGSMFAGEFEEGQEGLEQVTVFRGALPAEFDHVHPPLALTRTRSGGENLFVSLRDTFGGGDHELEGAAGGRIVPETLWFFADAWRGGEEGEEAKLTAQLGARHNVIARYMERETSLQYTGAHDWRWTTEALGSEDTLFAKTTYVLANHILSAGGRLTGDDFYDTTGAFVNDRWSLGRTLLNLGIRHDHGRIHPRAAVSIDLVANGRHAITGSLGDYNEPWGFVRELTAGYAMAIGNTGTARVDAIRRDFGSEATEGLQADFIYSLFDRFHTGANYAYQSGDFNHIRHAANGWASIDLAVGDHEVTITVVERYRSNAGGAAGKELATDLALRYTLPVSRVRLTLAADATNVFDGSDPPFVVGRQVRGWVRVRMLP